MGTSMYRSTDAGRTFESYKGAPGGDDPKALDVDRSAERQRMILGADQGPTITLDGGRTWTPWYTVPNGEFYFVSTDNQFPYWVYAAQQDSGTVAIRSRSDFGRSGRTTGIRSAATSRGTSSRIRSIHATWYPHGNGHAIVRYDRVTGQSGPIYTPQEQDRFGPRPGMETVEEGPALAVRRRAVRARDDRSRSTWKRISPDLTARAEPAPASTGGGRGGGAGATIVALAPSPLDVNLLWAGTSNGLFIVTRDGGTTWKDVSPPRLRPSPRSRCGRWRLRLTTPPSPTRPRSICRTSCDRASSARLDFGATWQVIVRGMSPRRAHARRARGSRTARVCSMRAPRPAPGSRSTGASRGSRCSSICRPWPSTTSRFTANDAIIATWGRGCGSLDNVTPLRQIDAVRASADRRFCSRRRRATRVRWNNNQDTPLPPEVPAGQNPPTAPSSTTTCLDRPSAR